MFHQYSLSPKHFPYMLNITIFIYDLYFQNDILIQGILLQRLPIFVESFMEATAKLKQISE